MGWRRTVKCHSVGSKERVMFPKHIYSAILVIDVRVGSDFLLRTPSSRVLSLRLGLLLTE